MTESTGNARGQTFNSRQLRDALSSFATGVTIMTCSGKDGTPMGLTASSFNSVSMDPPLILWSITKTAFSAEHFRTAAHFAVHILATDQVPLSNTFARSGAEKFLNADYHIDPNGVPVIQGSACRLDCRTWAVYEGGDHWIIVGEVLALDHTDKDSLVFSGGTYATATPLRRQAVQDVVPTGQESVADTLILYKLARANRQLSQQFHASVRESGLTVPEWRVLANLVGQPGCRRQDLGQRSFVDPVILSDILVSLQSRGLCTIDVQGERWYVTETPEAKERVTHLAAIATAHEAEVLAGAGAHAIDDLRRLLDVLIENTRET